MKYLDIYKNTISEINRLSLLAFIALLPYPHHAARICWVVFLISWLLSLQILEKARFRFDKSHLLPLLPFAALVVFYLWNLISVGWAEDKQLAWNSVERMVNIPLVAIIAFFGVPKTVKWKECLNMLIVTCVISVGVYMFLYYWVHNPELAINRFMPLKEDVNWLDVEELTMHVKHRLHYSTLICAAIPSVWFLHEDWTKRFGKVKAIVYAICAILILMLGIYLSGSRQSLITLGVVAATLIVLFSRRHMHLVSMAVVTLLLVVSIIGVMHFHPRLQEIQLREMLSYDKTSQSPTHEPRVAIWNTALENCGEYSLYGVGTGNSALYMSKKYSEKGWWEYVWRDYGPHNQYLTVWIELGIAAMIFFLAIWLVLPWCYRDKTRQIALLFTEIAMLTMMTETVFGRIEGVFFVCLILLIISMVHHEETSREENNVTLVDQ